MRILFMGTSTFAIPTLKRLLSEGKNIIGVVTQPDRRAGRGRKICLPPIKEVVMYEDIPVLQPENVNSPESVDQLHALAPDIIIVLAYAQFLKKAIRKMPTTAIFNVHGSLLPKYRGGAPVHWAVINGEKETGVTTFHIEKGMDTGDIILQQKLNILPDENTCDLHDRLALIGADIALETIELLEKGQAPRIPQDNGSATFAPTLKREDGDIDWTSSAKELTCFIRGMNSWPVAFSHINGELLKIYKAHVLDKNFNTEIGTVAAINKMDGLVIQTGKGSLMLDIVQPKGSRVMRAKDYLNGREINVGDKFSPLNSC